mmetsp:Transcript_38334/g.91796  ORF Transcript_38334/g.91796 Transcript_38334/m.91796 type:complete len:130 (+) Transcript_38334:844-1233(+)
MNENKPNQTTGVISTPNAGGIDPLTNLSNGSVGHTIKLKGTSFALAVGYHDKTILHSMANEKKFRNGPRTADSGCTHASVSDIIIDEDTTSCIAPMDATWLSMLTRSDTSIGASCRWDGIIDDGVVAVT